MNAGCVKNGLERLHFNNVLALLRVPGHPLPEQLILNQLAKDVTHRDVTLLYSRPIRGLNDDRNLGHLRHTNCLDDVWRITAGTDSNGHGSTQRQDLSDEHLVESVIIADRRRDRGTCRQRDCRKRSPLQDKTTDKLRGRC